MRTVQLPAWLFVVLCFFAVGGGAFWFVLPLMGLR